MRFKNMPVKRIHYDLLVSINILYHCKVLRSVTFSSQKIGDLNAFALVEREQIESYQKETFNIFYLNS